MAAAHHNGRARGLRAAAWLAVLVASLAGRAARAEVVDVAGGTIDVAIDGEPPLPRAELHGWARTAARAVGAYYGRFPVARVDLRIRVRGRRPVGFGMMHPGDPPVIRIDLGPAATAADLARDWTLTHEMVHLGFPDVKGRHRWIEEGLATYVEPMARARIGALGEAAAWADLVRGLPKGVPGGGLDDDASWGRTYWGGALFWLLADLGVREQTRGGRGLEHVLRGIVAAGGTAAASWPLERVLREGDRAAGVAVLGPLHRRMAHQPTDVDLEGLWQRLGVRRGPGGEVSLDPSAPLAAVRTAMATGKTTGRPRRRRPAIDAGATR